MARRMGTQILGIISVCLILVSGATPAASSPPMAAQSTSYTPKALIYNGWYLGPTPTPTYLQTNFAWINANLPFDGQVVYARNPAMTINLSSGILSSTAYSYTTIYDLLSPLSGLNWTRAKHNFVLVLTTNAPHPYDDTGWTTATANFANLALACKNLGLKGFFFDNENYGGWWGTQPDTNHTTVQYQTKMRERGSQVMAAIIAQFSSIAVMSTHGPYVSEPKSDDTPPAGFTGAPSLSSVYPLIGPYFVGFRESIGGNAFNVDAGELYSLRTAAHFNAAYNWRKYTFANGPTDSPPTNCAFLPVADRANWSQYTSVGFGVYDVPFETEGLAALTTTLRNALRSSDRYVWFYTEHRSFYVAPGGTNAASQAWVDAVRAAMPALIYNGVFDVGASATPTPSFLQANQTWINDNAPFDGLAVYARNAAQTVNLSSGVLSSTAYTYTTMAGVLQPVSGFTYDSSTWTKVNQNFVYILTINAPHPYDDTGWATATSNFTNLALACYNLGLKGIYFDNERYAGWWGTKPDNNHTLDEYQTKMRARGNQVMAAMVGQFPGIAVISLHGPYLSEPKSDDTPPVGFPHAPSLSSVYPLTGPFFVGFREAIGSSGLNVDGGELYTLRSATDFEAAHTWRKTTFANSSTDCRFLPPSPQAGSPDDRTNWAQYTSIGFGLYDIPFQTEGLPALSTTIERALTQLQRAPWTSGAVDRYIWFYTEGRTFLKPASDPSGKGASQSWVDAVNTGRAR